MPRKGQSAAIPTRERRVSLRSAGLRPVRLWLPDTRSAVFRERCERESLSLANDPHEDEVLDWIAMVSDFNAS